MHELLTIWAMWKRNYIIGIGFSSATIESKIMSGEMLGDGNKRGLKNRGGAQFIENPRAESVDIAIKKLEVKYMIEMKIVKARYITEWSLNRIARELKMSKYRTKQMLDRALILIEGRLDEC